jgi:hypothetical protein
MGQPTDSLRGRSGEQSGKRASGRRSSAQSPVEEGRQRLKKVHVKRYRCLASMLGVIVMCMPWSRLGATWEP